MTDRKQRLAALADRVEALTGPDREVDAEIAVAVLGGHIVWRQSVGTMESYPVRQFASSAHVAGHGCDPVPAYTASLDAAMTLVRAGYGFQVDGYAADWWASLGTDEGFNAKASTPALALCAAALRAQSETVA